MTQPLATDYRWVQSSARGRATDKAHALTPRLPNDTTAHFVCGNRLPAHSVVTPAAGARRCGTCANHIENGTGWA